MKLIKTLFGYVNIECLEAIRYDFYEKDNQEFKFITFCFQEKYSDQDFPVPDEDVECFEKRFSDFLNSDEPIFS